MIDVHLSQMQGVVGLVPQPTTTGGGGNGGGNNDNTPALDYNGFSFAGNQQGPGQLHLSLAGGGGGPPDVPLDDEDEDDDDDEDEEDEEEEDDNRTRRGRRRLRDDREIKNEGRGYQGRRPRGYPFPIGQRSINSITGRCNC